MRGAESGDPIKSRIVGSTPTDGQKIAMLDDVFTTGNSKLNAQRLLQSLGGFAYPLLAVAVNRQEISEEGRNALELFVAETGTTVISIVTISQILAYLRETEPENPDLVRIANYLGAYGTDEATNQIGGI